MPATYFSLLVTGGVNDDFNYPNPALQTFIDSQWRALSSSPATPRIDHVAVAYRGHVYVIAGMNYEVDALDRYSVFNSVERYNGYTWEAAPPCVIARHGHTAVVYRDMIYIMGGVTWDASLSSVEVYDGSIWMTGAPLPVALCDSASVVYHDAIYHIGGRPRSLHEAVSSVYVFDGSEWKESEPLITPRFWHSAVVYRDSIYVIAGKRDDLQLSDVELFDGDTWSRGVSIQEARDDHATVVYQNCIYVIGGYNGTETSSSVEIFNASSTAPSWNRGPDLPFGLELQSAVIYGTVAPLQ